MTDMAQQLREAGALMRARVAERRVDPYEEWKAADPRNAEAIDFLVERVEESGDHGFNGFYFDLLTKARRYGSLSERQVDAALNAKTRQQERDARRAADEQDRRPVVEGTIQIEGEVVSTKWQENAYGGRAVMTVKDDRGFLVWGSVPSALDFIDEPGSEPGDPGFQRALGRGDRVRFTATVTASDRDECFGFFKRPRNAQWLGHAGAPR
jgi:hypothetical protein